MVYEIYLFIFLTVVLFFSVFYKFFLWIFIPFNNFFEYLKRVYYKTVSLNKIKDKVLESSDDNKEMKEEKKVLRFETKDIKTKLDRLFLQVEVLKQKGDLDGLEKKLIEILAVDENNIKALEMLSNLYINLGKDKKAFSLLKKLIQVDMENDNAIWNLAKIYLNFGEVDTADILIQKALSLNDTNHRYYVTYADVLYNKGKLEDAVNAIQKVLQLKSNNVIYMDALATLYEEMGEFNKAKAIWLEILDLEPDYEKAREKLK